MMRNKAFVNDYGQYTLNLDRHNQLWFSDLAEFQRCAGEFYDPLMSAKEYICYMPDDQAHYPDGWDGPVPAFDTLLDNYEIIKARKADETYGLTGQELADKVQEINQRNARAQRRNRIVQAKEEDPWYNMEPDEVAADIDAQWAATTSDTERLELLKELIKKVGSHVPQ